MFTFKNNGLILIAYEYNSIAILKSPFCLARYPRVKYILAYSSISLSSSFYELFLVKLQALRRGVVHSLDVFEFAFYIEENSIYLLGSSLCLSDYFLDNCYNSPGLEGFFDDEPEVVAEYS